MAEHPHLHHVGIVLSSEDEAKALMTLLGLKEDFRGYVPQWFALCIFTTAERGSPLEFVIPDGGPLLKFNKGLGGLHHVALEVSDLRATTEKLKSQGIKLLEEQPVKGAGNFICNFLSPVYSRGITVEFVQVIAAS
jgi:catechol 2,3-dioxygenase-like lactoylglutathione lyase family enzyme